MYRPTVDAVKAQANQPQPTYGMGDAGSQSIPPDGLYGLDPAEELERALGNGRY